VLRIDGLALTTNRRCRLRFACQCLVVEIFPRAEAPLEAIKLEGKSYDDSKEHSVGVGVNLGTLEDKRCKCFIIQPKPLLSWGSLSVEELQNNPHATPDTISDEPTWKDVKRTFRDASGLSRWTFSNSLFSLFSKSLSSPPW